MRCALIHEIFTRTKSGVYLYSKKVYGEWVFLLFYVDDIAIAKKLFPVKNNVKRMLTSKFDVQVLGEFKQYLSIEVTRDECGIYNLIRSKSFEMVVDAIGLVEAKASNVPIQLSIDKSKKHGDEEFLSSSVQYQKLLGCLMYISDKTCPDVAAAISITFKRSRDQRKRIGSS